MEEKLNKNENITTRILEVVAYAKKIRRVHSAADFEEICGLSKYYISTAKKTNSEKVGNDVVAAILRQFPEVDPMWLISGDGTMFGDEERKRIDYIERRLMDIISIVDEVNRCIHQTKSNTIVIPKD